MQNTFLSKFNVYDLFGYILVGGLGLLLLVLDMHLLDLGNRVPTFSLESLVGWFVVAFFMGHLAQAIAATLSRIEKSEFGCFEKRILEQAKDYFKLDHSSLNQVFRLCYMLSLQKDQTGQVLAFNALYGLYRGWQTIFSLQSCFLLVLFLANWFDSAYFVMVILSTVVSLLLYARSRRFFFYFRSKVLQMSYIVMKGLC